MKSVSAGQVRDAAFREISGVFSNPVGEAQATGASYAEVDLGAEIPGITVYTTKAAVMKIGTQEIEIPEGVVIFLPWVVNVFEVKQKAETGIFYVFGGN